MWDIKIESLCKCCTQRKILWKQQYLAPKWQYCINKNKIFKCNYIHEKCTKNNFVSTKLSFWCRMLYLQCFSLCVVSSSWTNSIYHRYRWSARNHFIVLRFISVYMSYICRATRNDLPIESFLPQFYAEFPIRRYIGNYSPFWHTI